jgi:hypothetical protein
MPDSCTIPLVAPANDPCAAVQYGKQIPQIFYQDMDGEAPELTTESEVQAALAATGVDKLHTLKNIAAGLVPEAADQTISGTDLPYGGVQVTGRTRTMTGRLQYATQTTHENVNKVNQRQKPLRVWLVDDKGFPQGPIENASLGFGAFLRQGVGQPLPSHYPLTLSYDSLEEPPFGATALSFLRTLNNVA